MRKQHLPDSEIQLQSNTNGRVQQHLPFLCHCCGLAVCSFPEHCSSPRQWEQQLWAGLSWQQLPLLLHTDPALGAVKMCVSHCASQLPWGYLSQLWPPLQAEAGHCWISNSRSLGAVTTILQVAAEVPQDCFVGGVQPELETFGTEKEFVKSLSKFPPKQHCQTVLCASFLTHYQLATFPF